MEIANVADFATTGNVLLSLIGILVMFLALKFILYAMKFYYAVAHASSIKGHPPSFPLGSIPLFKGSMINVRNVYKFGDRERGLASFWLMNEQVIAISHHEHIKEVFRSASDRGDPSFMAQVIHVAGEKSFAANTGVMARKRRQYLGQAFHFKNLRFIARAMSERIEKMINVLHEKNDALGQNEWLDVRRVFNAFTTDVVGKAVFGYEFESLERYGNDEEYNKMATTFSDAFREASRRQFTSNPFLGLKWLWIPFQSNRIHNANVKYLRETSLKVIQERKRKIAAGENIPEDLLQNMIDAKDDKGQKFPWTDAELRDNTLLLLFAGFDTSAVTLTNCFIQLSRHPEVQEKIFDEVSQILVNEDGSYRPTMYEDMAKLKYTKCVLQEVLRTMPVAITNVRQLDKDLDLDGVKVPKGMRVFIHHNEVHESSHNWENPLDFIPERWSDDKARDFYSWVPFGGGTRGCLGQRFATLESILALAVLVRRFKIQMKEPFDANDKITSGFVQVVRNGVPVRLTPRKL